MKKWFPILVVAVLLLGGCDLLNGPGNGNGTLRLALHETDDFDARTLKPELDMEISTYRVSALGPNNLTYGPVDLQPQSQVSIPELSVGAWTVTVEGLNADGEIIGRGTVTAIIIADATVTANLTITPISGNGTLSLSLSWPADVITNSNVEITLTDSDNVDYSLEVAQDATSASYSGEWAAGYYDLTIQLLNGSRVVWGTYEAVRILSGQTTYGNVDLTVEDIDVGTQGTLEVTIAEDMRNPFEVILTGMSEAVVVGHSMTVQAQVDPEGEYAYAWYLKGSRIEGENSSSITVGSELAEGIYNLNVRVTDGSVISSSGVAFKVLAQGLGSLDGQVLDASSDSAIEGAEITLYRGQTLVGSMNTSSSGAFNFDLVPGDNYSLVVTKSGYYSVDYINIVIAEEQTTFLQTILQVMQNQSTSGQIGGTVSNSLSGGGVAGAQLSLCYGMNNIQGTVLYSLTTDSSGVYYGSDIAAGVYTAIVQAEGYNSTHFTVVVVGGESRLDQHCSINPLVLEGQTRIVLTWGSTPDDLDSHLTGPTSVEGERFHVYYNNPSSSDEVNLDWDDTSSYGPETITIVTQRTGEYRYYIHDYSNGGSSEGSPSFALSSSGAQINVYQGSSDVAVATFNVPTGLGGNVWDVFHMTGTTITPVNTISYMGSSGTPRALTASITEIDKRLLASSVRK